MVRKLLVAPSTARSCCRRPRCYCRSGCRHRLRHRCSRAASYAASAACGLRSSRPNNRQRNPCCRSPSTSSSAAETAEASSGVGWGGDGTMMIWPFLLLARPPSSRPRNSRPTRSVTVQPSDHNPPAAQGTKTKRPKNLPVDGGIHNGEDSTKSGGVRYKNLLPVDTALA